MTGIIGVNLMDGNSFGGEPYFEDCLRITDGVRAFKNPNSQIEFDDQTGKILATNGDLPMLFVSMRDGHRAGQWQVTYKGEPYDEVTYVDDDPNGGKRKQKGSTFTRTAGSDGALQINLQVGHDPASFECRNDSSVRNNSSGWRKGLIESLRPFKVLRVMDLQRMNFPTTGIKRPAHLVSYHGHDNYGMHPAFIANLCKLVGATPWLCIHEAWSLTEVREYLSYFNGMKCYVEGGNENWNRGMHHGRVFGADRVKALLHFMPAYRIANEAGHMCVLPTQEAGLGGQLGNTQRMVDAIGGEISLFHTLAGKAYFGGGRTEYTSDAVSNVATLQRLMDDEFTKLTHMRNYAHSLDLEHGVYECGQAMDDDAYATPTNRHPLMEDVYFEFCSFLQENAEVACLYAHTFRDRGGMAWGLKENGLQEMTPKLRGVMGAMEIEDPETDPETDPKPDPDDPKPGTIFFRVHPDDIERIADALLFQMRNHVVEMSGSVTGRMKKD